MSVIADPVLVVPGLHDDESDRWQRWLQQHLPQATWIDGIERNEAVLAQWALCIRDALAKAPAPQWLIAHGFGCLASVVAAADRPEQVAQLVLVSPADPDRFDCMGLRPDRSGFTRYSLPQVLPQRGLQVSGILVASHDDPWLAFDAARALATQWQLDLHDAGRTGAEPWPGLLPLLQRLRQRQQAPHKPAAPAANSLRRGRGSVLAAVRQLTREQMQSPQDHRLWSASSP
ncbi:MAG TPA: alpha/beta hydrolase [Candidatus Acidoferrum sp.]|nr:alpha/beta hydrolase [Candidatus Acidoferrum sp.]